jgi:hypothetical protein
MSEITIKYSTLKRAIDREDKKIKEFKIISESAYIALNEAIKTKNTLLSLLKKDKKTEKVR